MINIPFNFQPSSVSVKTGSYTIPAGSYAYVSANVEGTGTFTIGGSTALRGTSNSQTTNTSTNTVVGTVSGAGANSLKTSAGATTSSESAAFGYGSSTFSESVTTNFWLPTGTVINGTGTWRATVSLYNEIT